MPSTSQLPADLAADDVVARCLRGEIPPPVAVSLLALGEGGAAGAVAAVGRARRAGGADAVQQGRLDALVGLVPAFTAGAARVAELARGPTAGDPEDVRRLFDDAVAASEEASVALYSLGDPGLLARATREVVAWLDAAGLVPAADGGRVLELGCGIGRFEQALAPRVGLAVGLDVSPGMLAAAARRAAALPETARAAAAFVRTGGRDLAMFRDAAFDLVLAVDAFPYVFAGGPALADATVAEMARVVRPGGDVVIVNFSYRGDLAADRRDAAALAARHGLELVVAGEQPFAHWDGAVFHLRRRSERRAARRPAAFEAETLASADALTRLAPEWRALHDRCPWTTPFQSPEWLLAWWRHLGGEAEGNAVRAIAVRDAATGALAALLPGFTYADPERGGARTFALLGAGVTDYGDAPAEPAAGAAALGAAARHLAADAAAGAWDAAAFDELRDESPLAGALLGAAWPAGFAAARAPQSVAPARPLPGAWEGGWDAFAATLGSRFRRKLALGANRLRRAGQVELVTADARTLPAALDALFALHGARWRSRGESGVLADDRLAEFHAEAAAGFLARGWLRLRVLRIGGGPAAVLYTLVHRGTAYCYLSGLDPAFQYYSPGVAIVRAAVEAAIAEGCRTLDFLRGGERYKYDWGVEDQTTWRVTVGSAPAGAA